MAHEPCSSRTAARLCEIASFQVFAIQRADSACCRG